MKKRYLTGFLVLIVVLTGCTQVSDPNLPIATDSTKRTNTGSELDSQPTSEYPINQGNNQTGAIIGENTTQEGVIEEVSYELPSLEIDPQRQGKKIVIPNLMFHYIEDIAPSHHDQVRYRLSFSPEKFEQLLIALDEEGVETLTFWDVKAILEGKKSLPEKAVILGFDDGHDDHYTAAFPLLEKYHKKGVFFVISRFADQDPNYMTREQIRTIHDAGHEIGGHSATHPNLATLGPKRLADEIITSKHEIQAQIGRPVISLAYPLGKYNNSVLKLTQEQYLFGRTTHNGSTINTKKLNLIPTIRITPTHSIKGIMSIFE